eukprot:m.451461 g.451461  ORF g.451461 m.451461 type:complete len:312 (-) comp56917_c0_seq11:175-1110(-)
MLRNVESTISHHHMKLLVLCLSVNDFAKALDVVGDINVSRSKTVSAIASIKGVKHLLWGLAVELVHCKIVPVVAQGEAESFCVPLLFPEDVLTESARASTHVSKVERLTPIQTLGGGENPVENGINVCHLERGTVHEELLSNRFEGVCSRPGLVKLLFFDGIQHGLASKHLSKQICGAVMCFVIKDSQRRSFHHCAHEVGFGHHGLLARRHPLYGLVDVDIFELVICNSLSAQLLKRSETLCSGLAGCLECLHDTFAIDSQPLAWLVSLLKHHAFGKRQGPLGRSRGGGVLLNVRGLGSGGLIVARWGFEV